MWAAVNAREHSRAGTKFRVKEKAAHSWEQHRPIKKRTYIRRDAKKRLVQFHDVDELGQGRRRQVKGQEAVATRGHARLRRRRHQLAPTSERLVLRHRRLGQIAVPALAVVSVGERELLLVNNDAQGEGDRSSSRPGDLLHGLDGDVLELLKDDGQRRWGRIRCRLLGLVVEQYLGLAVAEREGHKEEAAALVPHAWGRWARARWWVGGRRVEKH